MSEVDSLSFFFDICMFLLRVGKVVLWILFVYRSVCSMSILFCIWSVVRWVFWCRVNCMIVV